MGCLLTRATAAGQIQLVASRGQFPGHAEELAVYVNLSKEMGLPRWLSGKEPTCNAGDRFNLWVRKMPWRRAWQPTEVFLPWKNPINRGAW